MMYFIDIIRLQQDFQIEVEYGNHFLAEPNMVILSKVTPENIKNAISKLMSQGFFNELGANQIQTPN